jgi:hypothetical protein
MKKFKTYINEIQVKDVLPPSGGGNDATDNLVKTYAGDTPGQSYKHLKKQMKGDYIKKK